jgi:glycosyltransferase involved in cell wall biosynthesis
MKIAWFTPFNPRSAIGHYSSAIVEHLARTEAVTVFASELDLAHAPRPSRQPVVRMPAVVDRPFLDRLAGFDVIVYNMGNYTPYHQAIFELAPVVPGVVILHDVVLRDFFFGYCYTPGQDPASLARLLGYSHGPLGELQGRDILAERHQERLEDPARLQLPLFRPALRRSLGVIVHSEYARERVQETCSSPVLKLDFPIYGPVQAQAPARPRNRPGSGRVRLLTFGVLNPNKLVHATLAAIGSNPFLRANVTFQVIGETTDSYRRTLDEFIRRYGLGEIVELLGYRSDEELRELLLHADIVVNLRNPHLGESSGSLLSSLVAGVPTVVWNHGFYAEFPDDVVCKINSEAELGPRLEQLVRDPAGRQQLGSIGRTHALGRFNVETFCERFLGFAEEVTSYRPVLLLTDRVSDCLVEFGADASHELARVMAREVSWLLPTRSPRQSVVRSP